MEIPYQLTDSDYQDFYEFNALHTPQGQKAMRTQILMMPIILGLFWVITFIMGVGTTFLLIQIPIYLAASWMWAQTQKKSLRSTAAGVIQKLEKKGMHAYNKEGSLCFEDHSFCDKGDADAAQLSYSDITAVYSYSKGIYLYLENQRVILLPWRLFENDSDKIAFCDLLKKKVSAEKIFDNILDRGKNESKI